MADRMPRREDVDPLFDGHLERDWSRLTIDERLDWIWQAMVLLRAGITQRARASVGNDERTPGDSRTA